MNRFIRRVTLFSISVTSVLFLLPDESHADLLIDPANGTDIFTPKSRSFDDDSLVRKLGGTFDAAGVPITEISVSVDGRLQSGKFVADVLDDDLILRGGGPDYIRENVTPDYYTVTWNVRGYPKAGDFPPRLSQFQVTLFKNPTTVRGTAYRSGDIVFSYGRLYHYVDTQTFDVSVYDQQERKIAPFGGDGSFSTTAQFLSKFNSSRQGILFRRTGDTYTQSLVPLGASPPPSAASKPSP
jgi:hypothetical protein